MNDIAVTTTNAKDNFLAVLREQGVTPFIADALWNLAYAVGGLNATAELKTELTT